MQGCPFLFGHRSTAAYGRLYSDTRDIVAVRNGNTRLHPYNAPPRRCRIASQRALAKAGLCRPTQAIPLAVAKVIDTRCILASRQTGAELNIVNHGERGL